MIFLPSGPTLEFRPLTTVAQIINSLTVLSSSYLILYDHSLPSLTVTHLRSYIANVARLAEDGYIPTADDILRARAKTTGIIETEWTLEGTIFKFVNYHLLPFAACS